MTGSKTIPWKLCEIKEDEKEQGRKYELLATLGVRDSPLPRPCESSIS